MIHPFFFFVYLCSNVANDQFPACFCAMQVFRISLIFSFLLMYLSSNAQTDCTQDCSCDFQGIVKDQLTGEVLPFANVRVMHTEQGTTADEQGVFHLHNLCKKEFDLQVSYVGYKTVLHHHDTYHSSPTIYLSPDALLLESIVVEDEQAISGALSATEQQIELSKMGPVQGDNLANVLQQLPGLNQLATGANIVKPVLHGLHSSRLVIINNGVRLEGQNWGVEHAPEIDPAQAERITVVKGASAIRYGANALAGAIVIAPPTPHLHAPLHGYAISRFQSNGRSAAATLQLKQGGEELAWLVQGSGILQGDLHAPDYNLSNTGKREASALANLTYHKKQWNLGLRYNYFYQSLGILRGSVTGNIADLAEAINRTKPSPTFDFTYDLSSPRQEVTHHQIGLEGTYALTKGILQLQYALQHNTRKEFDVRRGNLIDIPAIHMQLLSQTLEASWEHPEWMGWIGSLGTQVRYLNSDNIPGTQTPLFLPNYNTTTLGLYAIESRSLGKQTLDAGFRFDYFTNDIRGLDSQQQVFRNQYTFSAVSGSLGLLSPISAYSSLKSQLATAWRPPNIAELYSFGYHGSVLEYGLWRVNSGQEVAYTQDEQPVNSEISYQLTETFEHNKGNTSLEVTAYVNYLRDFIYTRPIGLNVTVRGAFPAYQYFQTNALFYGLDLNAEQQHNSHFSSTAQLSLLRAQDIKNEEEFVGIVPNFARYSLAYRKSKLGPFNNFNTRLQAQYSFKQFFTPPVIPAAEFVADPNKLPNQAFDFLEAPEGYFLINWKAAVTTKNWEISLAVNNLLNNSFRSYTNRLRYYADEPGRNFSLGLKYLF